MINICKYYGGSTSYSLSTENSDLDERGLFIHTDPKFIIGLNKFDHLCQQNEKQDSQLWEIRHFFNLLKNGNTQALEMLFNEKWIEKSNNFDYIIKNRLNFIDTEKIFKCLQGYCYSELKLAIGERTGKLGGKRQSQVEKYGFSPKNFVQLIRLSYCGYILFKEGFIPLDLQEHNQELRSLLLDIKNNPFNYKKENLVVLSEEWRNKMINGFDNRSFSFKFDENLANNIIFDIYFDVLSKVKTKP